MAINLNTPDNNKKPKISEKVKNAMIYGILIAVIAGVFIIRPVLQDAKSGQQESDSIQEETEETVPESETTPEPNLGIITENEENGFLEDESDEVTGVKSDYYDTQAEKQLSSSSEINIPQAQYQQIYKNYATLYTSNCAKICDIWIPTGYTGDNSRANEIRLKPSDTEITVDGNEPITITWLTDALFRYYDTLVVTEHIDLYMQEEKIRDLYQKFDYYLESKYDCFLSADNTEQTCTVYVFRSESVSKTDPERIEIKYIAALSQTDERGRHAGFVLNADQLAAITTGRYPDLLSLTQAIFRPAV